MMRSISGIILAVAAMLLVACSPKDRFSITVDMGEDIERTLTMTYSTPSGTLTTEATTRGGKAVLEGRTPAWSVASLAWSDGEPVAKCIVRNGEHLKLSFSPGNPDPKIKGSDPTALLYAFISDHDSLIAAGATIPLAEAACDFIAANPASPASMVVLTDYLDARDSEALADSLLEMIDPAARPASLRLNYGVVNALAMSESKLQTVYPFSAYSAKTDSLERIRSGDSRFTLLFTLSSLRPTRRRQVDILKNYLTLADSMKMRMVEISSEPDSVEWRRTIAGDGVEWTRLWLPGGNTAAAIKRLAIPREPFYILIDSTGFQRYRGGDLTKAIETMREQRALKLSQTKNAL